MISPTNLTHLQHVSDNIDQNVIHPCLISVGLLHISSLHAFLCFDWLWSHVFYLSISMIIKRHSFVPPHSIDAVAILPHKQPIDFHGVHVLQDCWTVNNPEKKICRIWVKSITNKTHEKQTVKQRLLYTSWDMLYKVNNYGMYSFYQLRHLLQIATLNKFTVFPVKCNFQSIHVYISMYMWIYVQYGITHQYILQCGAW